jgi:hypothetical protein
MGVCSSDSTNVFHTKPAWARWHAANWDPVNNVLRDSSGNNRHSVSVEGTIQVGSSTGYGASVPQTYIYGDVNTKVLFPEGSIPGHFTLCTMSRYNGPTKGRIITSFNANFVHGQWWYTRGQVYYDTGEWMSSYNSPYAIDDWLVTCGKNSGTPPGNILFDGQAAGVKSSNFWAGWQLSINKPNPWPEEISDWAVSHIIVWDEALTDSEMAQVSSAMLSSLSDASVQVTTLGSASFMALEECSGAGAQLECQACQQCAAGTYSAPVCQGGCLACPYGTFSAAAGGASACTQRPPGTFTAVMAATACASCDAGKYADFEGSTACLDVSPVPQHA